MVTTIDVAGERTDPSGGGSANGLLALVHEDSGWEVGLLPEVGGRVVLLRKDGGPNLLKADPSDWFPAEWIDPVPEAPFRPFNGHIYWLSPQSAWWDHQDLLPEQQGAAWPPDPFIIYGKYEAVRATRRHVELRGPESPISGVRMEKTVAFEGPRTLRLSATITNVRDEPVTWGLWSNTRFDGGTPFYVPMNGLAASGVRYDHGDRFRGRFPENGRWFTFPTMAPGSAGDHTISNKAYLSVTQAWVAVRTGGFVFVKTMASVHAPAVHPHQALVEIYLKRHPSGRENLLEVEFHGPQRHLLPGESTRLEEIWHLLRDPGMEEEAAFLAWLEERMGETLVDGGEPGET